MGWFLPFLGKALVGAGVSAAATSLTNRANTKATVASYQRNRADYLEDRDEQRIYDTKMRDESRAYNEGQSDKAFNRLNDLKAMRQRVEDAGLNFSSYIKGGGGISGGGTPFETPSQGASFSAPTMASANIKQSAGGAFVNTFFNSMQDTGLQEERDRLEVEIMREELKGMQRDGEALTKKNWGYSIPHAVTTTRVQDDPNSIPTDASGRPIHDDRSGLRVAGSDVARDPNFSDAEFMEARYGDVASSVYGLAVAGADMNYNISKRPSKPGYYSDPSDYWKKNPVGPKVKRPRARPTSKTPTNYGNVNYPRWPEHNLTHRRGWLFQ